jgi:hypothetical protein
MKENFYFNNLQQKIFLFIMINLFLLIHNINLFIKTWFVYPGQKNQ